MPSYVLNPDGGGVVTDHGKPLTVEFEATEKLYADYQVLATNPGGHSSLPTARQSPSTTSRDALAALERSPFPFELNNVTREYFKQMAQLEPAQRAADMRAILATPPDPAAIAAPVAKIRATTRPCAPPAWPPCSRGGHAPMRCRSAPRPTSTAASSPGIRRRKSAWRW